MGKTIFHQQVPKEREAAIMLAAFNDVVRVLRHSGTCVLAKDMGRIAEAVVDAAVDLPAGGDGTPDQHALVVAASFQYLKAVRTDEVDGARK